MHESLNFDLIGAVSIGTNFRLFLAERKISAVQRLRHFRFLSFEYSTLFLPTLKSTDIAMSLKRPISSLASQLERLCCRATPNLRRAPISSPLKSLVSRDCIASPQTSPPSRSRRNLSTTPIRHKEDPKSSSSSSTTPSP